MLLRVRKVALLVRQCVPSITLSSGCKQSFKWLNIKLQSVFFFFFFRLICTLTLMTKTKLITFVKISSHYSLFSMTTPHF